jgi:hypothetical protein
MTCIKRSAVPFLFALVAFGLFANAEARREIVPLRASASFSSRAIVNLWKMPILGTDTAPVYVLSLEPDFDVRHRVTTVELVLRRAGDSTSAPNLLDPTGTRHGLQAYDFAAADLSNGIGKSAYGQKREVVLKRLGLVVSIVISKATVSSVSATDFQIDELNLQVEVDNVKS